MKNIITFLFITIFSIGLYAQTVYTSASFFQEGDLLFTAMDNVPAINIGSAGANQNWDFTSLSSGQEMMTEIMPASSGNAAADFPNADVYLNIGAGEIYLEILSNEIRQLGFAGDMGGFDATTIFTPPGKYKVAPLAYQSNYTDEYGVAFTIPADQIPFIDQLGLPITPDSIRLTQLFETVAEVDAWGTMSIPSGIYDVLRLKKLETTSTMIEAYIGGVFPVWIDVTDLLIGAIPDFGLPGGGNGTRESYEFLADGVKESIATVSMDTVGGNPVSVTYKVDDTGTAISNTSRDKTVFAGYPNPAFNDVKVDIRGFEPGKYQIKLYNLTGKIVQTNDYSIQKDSTVIFNVSRLPKGAYLYALVNEAGETLKANRLMVIKP